MSKVYLISGKDITFKYFQNNESHRKFLSQYEKDDGSIPLLIYFMTKTFKYYTNIFRHNFRNDNYKIIIYTGAYKVSDKRTLLIQS